MKRHLPKRGLRGPTIVPGYSMDEIDRASYQAGPSPFSRPAVTVKLARKDANHPDGPTILSLDGQWQMAEGGDAKRAVRERVAIRHLEATQQEDP